MLDFSLLAIFTAGVLTFITPCVLPLMPIYLSALIGGDIRQIQGVARGQLLWRAGLFSLGFILVFTLMGLTASSIGSVLINYKAAIQGAGALLIVLFGLKFLGVIRIPFFDRIVRADDTKMQTRFGGINAFIMGLVFAAGWSPCVGPVLGSILTYTASTTTEPLVGAGYLALYGFGFAIPLFLTAAFAEAGVRWLKKINPYLPKIERAIGVFLLIIAGSLLWDLTSEINITNSDKGIAAATEEIMMQDGESYPVMVELYSKDCQICKEMQPIVDGIKNQCNGNQVRVKAYDITDPKNAYFAKSFRVVGVPTFLFLSAEGEEVARLIGSQTEGTLKQALSALRGKPCPGLSMIEGEDLDLSFPEQEDVAACSSGESADMVESNVAEDYNCEENQKAL